MTAAAERTDEFTYELNPKSGAHIWLKAPVDSRNRPMYPDLHINSDWAEELVLVLLQAIDDVRQARELQSEDGISSLGPGDRPR